MLNKSYIAVTLVMGLLVLSCVVKAEQEQETSVRITNDEEDRAWDRLQSQALGSQQCAPGGPRVDCGFAGITQSQCEAKGCCWNPYEHLAWCFQPSPVTTYIVKAVSQESYGFQMTLAVNGSGPSLFGSDIQTVNVMVSMQDTSTVRIKITDPNNKRWEVPTQFSPEPATPSNVPSQMDYNVAHAQVGEAFWITVTRASDGSILFSTKTDGNGNPLPGLVFEDQYLGLSTYLPSKPSIYGLGDKVRSLLLDYPRRYTMWNFDTPDTENDNLYGSHPFYLDMRPSGMAHGVFLRNSNGMDISLESGSLTFNVIGGVLDFFIFTGSSPDKVIQEYTNVIGTPFMPPVWSLGFHLCRYGYHNVSSLNYVIEQMKSHNIPLEVMWTDIDYMDAHKDFTLDPVNFPADQMNQMVDNLHANKQKYIVIVDPAIANQQGYPAYDQGIKDDIFVKDANGQVFIGKVWPGLTAFPDFSNPNVQQYWQGQIADFLKLLPVDSLWIDMNEPSNFCNGPCGSAQNRSIAPKDGFDPNNPPYRINNQNSQQPLDTKTVSADAVHYNGVLEYNIHNLYGLTEAIATKKALMELRGTRSFVLSRSTFPSSGVHTAHWTGDNTANWDYLYQNIPGALSFNMYGIPMVGSDICGFLGDTTEELCTRWMVMGSFMTFMRNHNTIGAAPQEPFRWPSVAAASRRWIMVRYSLLPYYYNLLKQSSDVGSTVLRPMFFEFPQDTKTFGIDRQFMVGSGMLISPCLTQGATSVSAYFPQANWYDMATGRLTVGVNNGSVTLDLQTPVDEINVHIRGGSIIPMQVPAMTITDTVAGAYKLLVALDENGKANGNIYNDDGVSINTQKTFSATTHAEIDANSGGIVEIQVSQSSYSFDNELETITILGASGKATSAAFNGKAIDPSSISWDGAQLTFTLSGVSLFNGGSLSFHF